MGSSEFLAGGARRGGRSKATVDYRAGATGALYQLLPDMHSRLHAASDRQENRVCSLNASWQFTPVYERRQCGYETTEKVRTDNIRRDKKNTKI